MVCSPPCSSVHGIPQARILEWVAIPFSRGSSQRRDQTGVFCIAGRVFTVWATREAPLYQQYHKGITFDEWVKADNYENNKSNINMHQTFCFNWKHIGIHSLLEKGFFFEHEFTYFNFLKFCLTKTTKMQCHDFICHAKVRSCESFKIHNAGFLSFYSNLFIFLDNI